MAKTFLSSVQHAFDFLGEDAGYRLLDSEEGDSFDNAEVYFGSDRFRVRILRDRGQVFIDFAPPDGPPYWFDMPLLLRYLGYEALADTYVRSAQRSLEVLANLLRPHLHELGDLYAQDRQERTLRDLKALQESSMGRG
jgi:hypothetical protein